MDFLSRQTFGILLDVAAQPQTPLARAIRDMRQSKGWSHDTLVTRLREDYGLDKASRTLVISWEKKARPSGPYRDALVALGVDDRLWAQTEGSQPAPIALMREALERQDRIEHRLDQLDSHLQSLEEMVGQVAERAATILEQLAAVQARREAAR